MRTECIGHPRGSALVIGFILVLLVFALALSFAGRLSANHQRMESDVAGERAYELAQTANTMKIQRVWADFKLQDSGERVAWLGGEDANGNGKLDKGEDVIVNTKLDPPHAQDYQDSTWFSTDSGFVCTRIKMLSMLPRQWVLVRFTTWARVADSLRDREVVRKVQRVARFSMKSASIFDFAYFATNYGTIDGNKISIYGPLGANGDIRLANSPIVDGRIYAASNLDTGLLGKVAGKAAFDDLTKYRALMAANRLMRPTNPTAPPEDRNKNGFLDAGEDLNLNGQLDSFKYDLGFDGTQDVSTQQTPAMMPLLEDLEVFKEYSNTFVRPANASIGEPGGQIGGVVKQLKAPGLDPTDPANYRILIDRVYGDSGESGLKAIKGLTGVSYSELPYKIEADTTLSWKNGNISLIGTPDQPLVIEGPVVVTNDLVIRGTITGQGTFFVGRNTHVTGDILYKDPPQWNSPDINFDKTVAMNKKKDIVGFGSRGNIILGNYTDMDVNYDQWDTAKNLMKPPYIKNDKVKNPHDDLIGYGDPQPPPPPHAPPPPKGSGNSGPGGGSSSGPGSGGNSGPGSGTPPPPPPPKPPKKPTFGTFPGDYTVVDGDKHYLDNDSVPALPNRAYYESTFSEAYIKSVATKPTVMDGIFYAGHLIAGRANNLTVFGSIVAHDEGVLSDGSVKIIFDPRASPSEPKTYINLFLPANAALDVVYWKDSQADDASPASPDW